MFLLVYCCAFFFLTHFPFFFKVDLVLFSLSLVATLRFHVNWVCKEKSRPDSGSNLHLSSSSTSTQTPTWTGCYW